MKVGLSTTMIEPALTGGRVDGIGVYTRALQQHLPALGAQVQGFSFPAFGRNHAMQAGHAFARSYEVSSLIDLAGLGRQSMPIDVFHATDYRIVRMDCPVVATLHDAVPIKFPHWCTPRLRGLKNWLQKRAAQKADRVIALSNYAVTELVECFGVLPERITVVPMGVGQDWLVAPEAALVAATLARHQLQPGYFLFVGTLQPRKNVERIVEAWQTLPAALQQAHPLVIVGRAGWQCDALLAQMKAAQQNGAKLHWLSDIADEATLRHLYAGAGVFVFPSLYEGFGMPVLEAFAARVPVITSNSTSLPEVAQDAAWPVDPLSVGQIADAMRQLVQDSALRERLVQQGWQRVQQLTWQQTAQQTAAVYRAAMAGRG